MNSNEPIVHEGRVGLLEIEPVLRRSRRMRNEAIARSLRRFAHAIGSHTRHHAHEIAGLFHTPAAR
ncbi:hypothetical protein KBTX_00534 [wastewater metagenome]|uniref:Uncharacterized protein n=2 Tax=unclassified sequences TaxID=12908 RepID=A0A5B8R6H7_9ZZZZ|nr:MULTISPECIES: hypothetical protein [Arhodomonas]MCS4504053.1 hypothetical protein [Arhodomonas aquaeolei]QEA04230.1 hypothetical protein KBTEX_00534 [uncultured organism]